MVVAIILANCGGCNHGVIHVECTVIWVREVMTFF